MVRRVRDMIQSGATKIEVKRAFPQLSDESVVGFFDRFGTADPSNEADFNTEGFFGGREKIINVFDKGGKPVDRIPASQVAKKYNVNVKDVLQQLTTQDFTRIGNHYFGISPIQESIKMMTEEQFDEAAGEKDACYHKVKSRYKVWPSAYASGALVKCRKVGAANWGKSKK